MKKFIAKKTCYWGPQPGAESLIPKGTEILAHGNEPHLDEFFEAVDKAEEVVVPKKGKASKAAPVDENDL